jgi:NAD+ kinase
LSTTPRIAFVASKTPEALASLAELQQRFGEALPQEADIIVALGGDGFMLQTLHRYMATSAKPVYGMKARQRSVS